MIFSDCDFLNMASTLSLSYTNAQDNFANYQFYFDNANRVNMYVNARCKDRLRKCGTTVSAFLLLI